MRTFVPLFFKQASFWVIIISVTVTVGWFARALFVGFLSDDYDFLDYVLVAIQTPYPAWTLLTTSIGGASFFRPVINLSFLIDYRLYHLAPFGYHLTNLLFFGGSIALVVLIAQRLTGSSLRAWLIGLLFLVSPFTAESVVWISGRTDVLMLFFLLLSVWFFIYFRDTLRLWSLIGIAAAAFLAAFSKENSVALVAICVFIDLLYFQSYRDLYKKTWYAWRQIFYPYWVLLLVFFVYFIARYAVLNHWFYTVTEAGNARFLFGGVAQIVQFILHFGNNIMHVRGFEWLGVSQNVYRMLYGIGLALTAIALLRSIMKRSWDEMRDWIFGICSTVALLLPVLAYVGLVTHEHQDARFLFAPSLGVAWFLGSVTPFVMPKKFIQRIFYVVPLVIILMVWGVASFYSSIPYREASATLDRALVRVKDQILPDVQSVRSPGIYILGLPKVVHGAYAIPKHDIDRAIQLAYPELIDAEILNVGMHALHGSACAVQAETRRSATVFFYTYDDATGYRRIPFEERLVGRRTPVTLNHEPIDPTGFATLRIPLLQKNNGRVSSTAHLRWRFTTPFATIPELRNFFVTIPVRADDLARGYTEVQLCEYPLFFAAPVIARMTFESRGFSNETIEVGTPVFR